MQEQQSLDQTTQCDTTSMANLASTYRNQGRWDEVEKLFVDVMNATKANS